MSENKRNKIDELLKQMAVINCNIGKDSSEDEKRLAGVELKKIVEKIKKIDYEYFKGIELDEISFFQNINKK
jgi:hypothetical protein